jgi:hypothetical protein
MVSDAIDGAQSKHIRHHGNGLHAEAARHLSSSHHREEREFQADQADLEARYGAAGANVYETKPGQNWESVAKYSLRRQNRSQDCNDPDMVNREIARIMWETQKWKNSLIKDPAQRDLTPHPIAFESNMLVYLGNADMLKTPPGHPENTIDRTPPLLRTDDTNQSQHPIQSKAYGGDYGALGLYLVKGNESWPEIARMSLRWQNKGELVNNSEAVNREIARIMYDTEAWRVSEVADPAQRKFTPGTFKLERGMILSLWDRNVGPDQNHPNAFWKPYRQAPPGVTEAGYRDSFIAGDQSTVIAYRGSRVTYQPGSRGWVLQGAQGEIAPQNGMPNATTIVLTTGDNMSVPPGTHGVVVRNVYKPYGS